MTPDKSETLDQRAILLVDDDAWTADTALSMLSFHGFRAEWSPNVDAALARLREQTFDLVLLDLDLGQQHGSDLVIAASSAGVKLPPILIVSAAFEDEGLESMQKLGAVGFLRKPYTVPELLKRIDDAGHIGR